MIKTLENIIICPKTKKPLTIDLNNSVAKVEGTDIVYPIRDNIIDLLPDIKDKISDSYDSAAPLYDKYITSSTLIMKIITSIVWGFSGDYKYSEKVLAFIPNEFDGVLLDIPVGTGILTFEKYKRLKNARLILIDFSWGMLLRAKQLFEKNNIDNIILMRGDIANLPIIDDKIDLLLSMNGLHAFPRKELAIKEIDRVLKANGNFVGCFYIKGKRKFTDFLVNNIIAKQGTFTSPFYHESDIISMFQKYFTIDHKSHLKSIFYFNMKKNVK